MKTIIMDNYVTEAPGSLFPRTHITLAEAQAACVAMGGRLPTSEEYDRLFAARPWPHLIYERAADMDGYMNVVRGGYWLLAPRNARASNRDGDAPDTRVVYLGFRCARDIPDDGEIPPGWIVI